MEEPMSVATHIPVVDLEDLASPRLDRQARAAEAIQEAFGRFGLIYIRNHGIEDASLDSFYESFLAFTSLPEERKRPLSREDIWFQRGWTPPNTERAVVAGGQPDFKECYFAAPEPLDPLAALEFPQIYAENIWPEGNDTFRETYLLIGHQLHEVGLALLRGCARALGLEPYRFEAAVWGGPHVTRALRYLPLNAQQVNTGILWGEEHTDFNLLTLLPGGRFLDPEGHRCEKPDPESGLYLRTRPTAEHPQGVLVPGKTPPGCVVAQVGQELEIITGGRFLATPHVIKATTTPGYSRVSMAHFIHLHAHQTLAPLPPFRNAETLRAYSPPVLAGTYGTKTLVDIGLAPPAALDQLGYRHYDRLDEIRAQEEGRG
jgi:isopenicillin N synthase-like dioxygenase